MSDTAKFGVARLAGLEAPKFEDTEKTIDELKARIAKTIDYVQSVPASAFEGGEDRDIKILFRNRTLEMKGLTYLRGWLMPNFFFHVVDRLTRFCDITAWTSASAISSATSSNRCLLRARWPRRAHMSQSI